MAESEKQGVRIMEVTSLESIPWSECPWEKPYSGNARRTILNAMHPQMNGELWDIRISVDTVRRKSGSDRPGFMEFKHIVPEVLLRPLSICIGLLRDDGPLPWGIVYCGHPKMRYRKFAEDEIEAIETSKDHVFLIFVDEHREIYEWGWEICDPTDRALPGDWRERRFKWRVK